MTELIITTIGVREGNILRKKNVFMVSRRMIMHMMLLQTILNGPKLICKYTFAILKIMKLTSA